MSYGLDMENQIWNRICFPLALVWFISFPGPSRVDGFKDRYRVSIDESPALLSRMPHK